jgi:hypothetical protein
MPGYLVPTNTVDQSTTVGGYNVFEAVNAGALLQVVTAQPLYADVALNSTSETNVGSLITITPKSSTSKIVFNFTFGGYPAAGALGYYSLYVRRNSISGARVTSGTTTWGEWSHNYQTYATYGTAAHNHWDTMFWDEPGTTSAITYNLSGKKFEAGFGNFIMWSGGVNRVVAMEIAG